MRARGRTNGRKIGMNRTEASYAQHLEARKLAGEILWYGFESCRLILAERTTYTPDFFVLLSDSLMEFHEVKGFWEEDARVKIKVAARMFPMFQFRAFTPIAKKRGGGWKEESFE